jgi:hypothetical protein
MRTPLNQIRRKASRLNEPCSPQDLSAVTELGRHLNALDRQARRPEDRVKVRMVSPKPAGCCFGLAHLLQELGLDLLGISVGPLGLSRDLAADPSFAAFPLRTLST